MSGYLVTVNNITYDELPTGMEAPHCSSEIVLLILCFAKKWVVVVQKELSKV